MKRLREVASRLDGSTVGGSKAQPSLRAPRSHPLSRREP